MGYSRCTIGFAAVVTALALGCLLFLLNRERQYDSTFDVRVAEPTFRQDHPLVLYDEGHRNVHTADAAYKPFADLIRNDGYKLLPNRSLLTAGKLAGVAVLVVVCARGANDANDGPAFSDTEISAIEQWVRRGGSLLLITDHWPFGPAVESLALRFGVRLGKGLVEDHEHSDPSLGDSHLVFTKENGLLREHPIVRGRGAGEQIKNVLTFTGQSLLGPPESVALMAFSDAAVERPPTAPKVEKHGGNTRVTMEYGEPVSAKGRAQGIAMVVDRGRVVMIGESGMLRAQRLRNGSLVGMNHPGCDNRQLALNIMHWLSSVL